MEGAARFALATAATGHAIIALALKLRPVGEVSSHDCAIFSALFLSVGWECEYLVYTLIQIALPLASFAERDMLTQRPPHPTPRQQVLRQHIRQNHIELNHNGKLHTSGRRVGHPRWGIPPPYSPPWEPSFVAGGTSQGKAQGPSRWLRHARCCCCCKKTGGFSPAARGLAPQLPWAPSRRRGQGLLRSTFS